MKYTLKKNVSFFLSSISGVPNPFARFIILFLCCTRIVTAWKVKYITKITTFLFNNIYNIYRIKNKLITGFKLHFSSTLACVFWYCRLLWWSYRWGITVKLLKYLGNCCLVAYQRLRLGNFYWKVLCHNLTGQIN